MRIGVTDLCLEAINMNRNMMVIATGAGAGLVWSVVCRLILYLFLVTEFRVIQVNSNFEHFIHMLLQDGLAYITASLSAVTLIYFLARDSYLKASIVTVLTITGISMLSFLPVLSHIGWSFWPTLYHLSALMLQAGIFLVAVFTLWHFTGARRPPISG
jgi:hypothetical protein